MRRSIIAIGAIAAACAANASFTGSLADFGVNVGGTIFNGPVSGASFGQLQPGGGSAGHSSAGASTGVFNKISYTIWDGYGPHGYAGAGNKHDNRDFGGQQFDAKALYMSNDATYLYIGIVTGTNPAGVADPYGRARSYNIGDIAINSDWAHNTAKYAILMPTAGAGSSGSSNIMKDGTWWTPDSDVGFSKPALSDYKTGGTNTGKQADYLYSQIYDGGNPVQYYDNVTDHNVPIFLLEARVKWTDLGLNMGDSVRLGWAVSCNNDYIDGSHILTPVPEPGTIASLGSGLLAIGATAWRRRRRA